MSTTTTSPTTTIIRVMGTPLVALGLMLAAGAALAEGPPRGALLCSERHSLVGALDRGYGEEPVQLGLGNDGRMFELFASDHGATWSLVVTTPQGVSCLVATGIGWSEALRKVEGPEA